MSERHELPDPSTLTRRPIQPSAGGAGEQLAPEDAVAEMRERLEQETAKARAAERTADEERRGRVAAETRATEANGTAFSAQEQALETGISSQKALVDQAEASIAAAYQAGDGVSLARAQRQMAEATALLTQLSGQKQWMDAERERRKVQAPAPQQPQNSGALRVTTPGGTLEVEASAKDWMDKHPRFYNDADYYNHIVAAHGTIVADGVQPGTPAYYRALDTRAQRFEAFEAHERGEAPVTENINQRQVARRGGNLASSAAPVSRASVPTRRNDGQPTVHDVLQHIGGEVNEADLREYARINGYIKGRTNEEREAGFQRYLADHAEIIRLERSGQDTGLRTDAVYR